MEPSSVANEITIPVDVRKKGKNEHEKITGWKNGKHVTCHAELHDKCCSWEWQLLQKLVLPKKDMTLWTVTWCFCNKERASCWMSGNLSGGKDTNMQRVSQHKPQKQNICVRQWSDLKQLICYPSLTNKEHKNEQALLPAYLEWTRNKISFK